MINLSEWALRSRSLVAYIMIVAVIAGAWSYFKLGRSEDPAFIIKTMVVQAAWPGATVEETLKQVTERLDANCRKPLIWIFCAASRAPGLRRSL